MNSMTDSTVTITGGTGSFGNTMARHLLTQGVAEVRVLSRDEAKQDQMRQQMGDSRVKFFLGDVRDRPSVDNATAGADYVFHAAALKQVPSCEFFPDQAVKTNVTGSQNVIESAHRHRVSSVVCLSTDKAVHPINAMGMSKALMEKTAQAFARNHPESLTTVSVTRYGNVMYSRGSVIPLFVSQLMLGEPMTLTEPSMTRFLMSLEESVDLVLHAFAHAKPGDLFVKKAAATTVETLAHAVAKVLDKKPVTRRIGIRHGEKMYETLLASEESRHSLDQGDYFRVPLDARSLNYSVYVEEGESHRNAVEFDSNNATQMDVDQTAELIAALPEMRALLGASA